MGSDLISRQLLKASFRGIPFLVRSEATDPIGKRHIPHSYPNSDRRHIEDNGSIQDIFIVEAFVHGVDYLNNAQNLEEALKQDGSGILTIPNFGTHSVFAMPYTKRASQKRVGEIEFSLRFYLGTDLIAPSQTLATSEDVFDAGDNARVAINEDFKLIYEVPTERVNVETATSDVLLINNGSFEAVKDNVLDVSEIVNIKDRINSGIANIIKSKNLLADVFFAVKNIDQLSTISDISRLIGVGSLNGLFQSISIALDPNFLGIRSGIQMSNIGSSLPTWEGNTATRNIRNLNRKTVINSGQINGLVIAYEQAAGADYETQDDVKNARSLIEIEYNRLMQDAIEDGDLIQSKPTTRNAIENVRSLALQVLEQKQQQAFVLTDIYQPVARSSVLLAHKYYAENLKNTDDLDYKTQIVRDLNITKKSNALFGDLKVLQDV